MSLKNLATLYDEKVAQLYRYDKNDFNSGEPFYQNKLKPGPMDSSIKYESQSLPITSTVRDVKRMTNFMFSDKGIRFLAMQQLLQTGNYFKHTTLINPAFVLANAVPFIHLQRHLGGSLGIASEGTMESIRGRLQKTTGEAAKQRAKQSMNTNGAGKARAIRESDTGFIDGLIGGVKGIISSAKANLDPKSTVYQVNDRPDIDHFDSLQTQNAFDGPEIILQASVIASAIGLNTPIPKLKSIIPGKESAPANILDAAKKMVSMQYDAKSGPLASVRSYKDYQDIVRQTYATKTNPMTKQKAITYFNDQKMSSVETDGLLPRKITGTEYTTDQLNKLYKFTGTKDFIDVFVGVPSKSKNVQFRAFIKDIRHGVKPEYSTSKYIGRTEKYVTYSGTSRTMTFVLTLAAFSQEEMDAMYGRLNYLTGLTYPLGLATSSGKSSEPLVAPQLLQPPMISLTIGKILVKQPGYFTNLDIQYGESYDLDKQLPMLATVSVSYAILEKETMFYTNPTVGAFQSSPQQVEQIKAAATSAAFANAGLT